MVESGSTLRKIWDGKVSKQLSSGLSGIWISGIMRRSFTASLSAIERFRLYRDVKRMVDEGASWEQIKDASEHWTTRQAAHAWYKKERRFWGRVRGLKITPKS